MKLVTASNMSVATLKRLGFSLIKSDITNEEHKLFLLQNKGIRTESYQHAQNATGKNQIDLYGFIGAVGNKF